jgi:CTP synthase
VLEALRISSAHAGIIPDIDWLDASDFEGEGTNSALSELGGYDGVIVPGGFGSTGIDGKINAIEYVRENNIPFFGLCYGMQLALVEIARHEAGLESAHTTEIDEGTPHPVVDLMPEQKEEMAEDNYGGTMRLGSWPAKLREGTVVQDAYGAGEISERHRHRYEVNNEYIDQLEDAGVVFSGQSPDGQLMEVAELSSDEHPFFVGTQFHPEFKARVLTPHPLFDAFIEAATK